MQNIKKAERRRERRARRARMLGGRAIGAPEITAVLERTLPHTPDRDRARRSTNAPDDVAHHPSLATGEEVAQYLRVHLKTVERWRKTLGLPCLRIGGRIRYVLGDVTRWASARKEES